MTKSVLTAAAVLALMPASAFAQSTLQDFAFVQSASHVDLASVQEGRTAVQTASAPAVKSFAQEMVKSHNESHDALAAMVQPMAKPLTTTKSPCLTWQEVLLQQKAWSPYDAAYIQATVNNQTRLVSVLQGEIQAGTDPNVKDYAQKRLPAIQAQLEEAKRLQSGATVPVTPDTERDLFPSGGYQLSAAGERALADFVHKLGPGQAQMMVEHITVTGYTDTQRIGPDLARQGITTNEILSQKRADAVKKYLVSLGLHADLIETRGLGPADPVASNDTAGGRQQNRRVEITAGSAHAVAGGLGSVGGVTACQG
jgi:chemotaxis protein MotB